MRNREYWQKRFSAVEEMRNKRGKLTVDQIAPHFDRAQATIDKEIRVWYQRFADNNGISLAEAKKLLRQNELDELKWDIEEYIKRGQENAVSQKWLKELENASAKFHISRLEALKLRTQNAAENAFAAEQNRLTDRLVGTWKEDYYRTAFEVQKGFSLGFDVARVDENRVNKLLDTPWTADGQTFSDRIWKSKAQLLDSVSSELTQMCILGKAPDDAIAAIAKRMNVAKSQAGRLVVTENAYFGSVAQQQCYKDLDVERYQIVATLDSRTSDICRHLDGKVFDMKDYEPGVTAPPFHVYCRSCTVPYFADNDENGMRAARDENGKTYYVPADMTYEEWEKAFAGGGSKSGLTPIASPAILDVVEQAVGVRKGTPMEIKQAVVGANPNYSTGREYKINCQRCVQTYELRRRGYDVIAKPKPTGTNTVVWGSECFTQPGQQAYQQFTFHQTEAAIKRELAAAPDGARYTIYVQWKGRGSGAHVFIAEKYNGVIHYVDPQPGKEDVSHYFANGRKGCFGFFRMDDKQITTDQNIIAATVEVSAP